MPDESIFEGLRGGSLPAPENVTEVEGAVLDPDDEIPPEPPAWEPEVILPLRERLEAKLASMTPERKARYDSATAEIMAQPAVKNFALIEAHREERMEAVRAAFLKQKGAKG